MTRQMDEPQLRALRYLENRFQSNRAGAFLYMEMRMGKSFVATEFIKQKALFPALIVTTAKAVKGWMDESKHHPEVRWEFFTGTPDEKNKTAQKDFQILVSSYDSTERYNLLALKDFNSIILDESYLLASAGRNITQYFLHAGRTDRFRICLSGSPYAESIMQIAPQFVVADGHFMGRTEVWKVFEDFTTLDKYSSRVPTSGTEAAFLEYLHANAFMDTLKENNLGSEKEYGRIYCSLPIDLMRKYNEAVDIKREDPTRSFQRMWKLTSGFNLEDPDELVSFHKFEAFLEARKSGKLGTKQVVFCNFTEEIRSGVQFLCEHGIDARGMTGSTTMKTQVKNMEWFKQSEDGVILLQVVAYKMGLDFSSADNVVYLSNSTSGDARIQSEHRVIHRMKGGKVYIWDILVRQGVDIHIADLVSSKRIGSNQTMSEGAARARRLDG